MQLSDRGHNSQTNQHQDTFSPFMYDGGERMEQECYDSISDWRNGKSDWQSSTLHDLQSNGAHVEMSLPHEGTNTKKDQKIICMRRSKCIPDPQCGQVVDENDFDLMCWRCDTDDSGIASVIQVPSEHASYNERVHHREADLSFA